MRYFLIQYIFILLLVTVLESYVTSTENQLGVPGKIYNLRNQISDTVNTEKEDIQDQRDVNESRFPKGLNVKELIYFIAWLLRMRFVFIGNTAVSSRLQPVEIDGLMAIKPHFVDYDDRLLNRGKIRFIFDEEVSSLLNSFGFQIKPNENKSSVNDFPTDLLKEYMEGIMDIEIRELINTVRTAETYNTKKVKSILKALGIRYIERKNTILADLDYEFFE